MPRKRKRGQFDDYDDWQEAPTADDVQPEQEVAKVSEPAKRASLSTKPSSAPREQESLMIWAV